MQAGDDAHVRCTQQFVDGVAVVVLREQVHRLVARAAEALVDAQRQALDALLEVLVFLQRAARGRGHLHEDKAADPLGVLLQQPLDRIESLEDALGVVEAVDADGQRRVRLQAQALAHDAARLGHRRPARDRRVAGPLDRDRIGLHQRLVLAERDRRMLVLDARLEEAVDRLDEVLAVETGVEAQDRRAQHALQDLAPPRADAERFRVGPGDVPEGQDGRVGQLLAHHRGQQREVVVLHQHDGILAARLGHDGVGEALVDGLVGLPVRLAEHRAHVRHVAQRPQALVGKAEVVALLFLGRQPQAAQLVVVLARRHGDAVVGVDDLAVGVAAAVRDPGARAGAHHRLDGGHEAAGRALDDDAAVLRVLVDVGLAVGHDDHLVAAQLRHQQRLQALGAPVGLGALHAAVFVLEVAQALAQVGRERLQLHRGRGRRAAHRADDALAAQQRAHPQHPATPAQLRHHHRDQRHHQAQRRDQADQVAARVLAALLDEAQVVQQHEPADGHRRGLRRGLRRRARCGHGHTIVCSGRPGGRRRAGDVARRVGDGHRMRLVDDVVHRHVHRAAVDHQSGIAPGADLQRVEAVQIRRERRCAHQHLPIRAAKSDREQPFVLQGAVEQLLELLGPVGAHRLHHGVGQGIGHDGTAAVEVAREPAQRDAIDHRQYKIGRGDHHRDQRQQETELQPDRLHDRPAEEGGPGTCRRNQSSSVSIFVQWTIQYLPRKAPGKT